MTTRKTAVRDGRWNPEPPRTTSKYHRIRKGWSLCGQRGYSRGGIEAGKDDHPEHGAVCRRAKIGLDRRAAAGGAGPNRGLAL